MGNHKFNPFSRGSNLPPPPHTVGDAYGRTLHLLDEVIAPGITAPRFRVARIAPMLEPNAPPGGIKVTLICRVEMVVRGGTAVQEIFRVRTAAEAGVTVPDGTGDSDPAPEKETTRVVE